MGTLTSFRTKTLLIFFKVKNMKLLSLAATVLYFARADEDSQEAESALEEAGVDPKKFSGIVRMINSQITTNLNYETIVKRIQNYGCHCFPGMSRSAGGQGPPQDDLDSACHTLYRCHRCVEMDYSNACDVDKGKYRFRIQNEISTATLVGTQHANKTNAFATKSLQKQSVYFGMTTTTINNFGLPKRMSRHKRMPVSPFSMLLMCV